MYTIEKRVCANNDKTKPYGHVEFESGNDSFAIPVHEFASMAEETARECQQALRECSTMGKNNAKLLVSKPSIRLYNNKLYFRFDVEPTDSTKPKRKQTLNAFLSHFAQRDFAVETLQ